jgi:CPA1 family monovalent cation:H+ antiporter
MTFTLAWAGMRGVVSLAAALSVPVTIHAQPFPARDLIIFITFGVILGTLVVQGLSLPFVIHMLGLVADDEDHEELIARHAAAVAAVERLEALEAEGSVPSHLLVRTRASYDDRVETLVRQIIEGAAEPGQPTSGEHLARHLLGAEREAIILLRDRDMIGDETLRRLQAELDLQESKLTG